MFNVNPTDTVNYRIEVSKHNSNEGYEYEGKLLTKGTCAFSDIPYPDISAYVTPEDIGITDEDIGNGIDYEFAVYLYRDEDDDYAWSVINASSWYHGYRNWKWTSLED